MNDKEIIYALGGPTEVAKKLGYPLPQGCSKVANWLKRGIPPKVKLNNLELFFSALNKKIEQNKSQAEPSTN